MKKLVLTALTALSCGAGYALPVFNPIEASLYTNSAWWGGQSCFDTCDSSCFGWMDSFDVRIGFYGDYVFNRYLQRGSSTTNPYGCIDTTQLFTSAGNITINFCNWIDVFVNLGATHINLRTSGQELGVTDVATTGISYVDIDFSPTFSWSVGGRATLWECRCFGVGVEGQYFRTKPTLNSLTTANDLVYAHNTATYSEWQVGLGASYSFYTGYPGVGVIPYVGVKWAGAKFSMPSTSFTGNFKTATLGLVETHAVRSPLTNSRLWGFATGVTTTINNVFGMTVEGRWGDEKAVSVESQLRF